MTPAEEIAALTFSVRALKGEVARLREALEAVIDHAHAHVNDYHAAMKGYRQHQHDALDADMAKARAALARAEGDGNG